MAQIDLSPQARRARVFGSLGFWVFALAFTLCALTYGLAVWRDGQLLSLEAGLALGLFIIPLLLLLRPYWTLTAAHRPGFIEGAVRLLLTFLLWVGSLWYLLLFAYLALELALSSGLML